MDLNELSLDYLVTKPASARIAVLLALFFIILLLAYLLLIKPRMVQLASVQKQQGDLKISYQRQQGMASKLSAYQEELKSMQVMENSLLAQLTSVSELSSLIAVIAKLGAQNGLEMNLLKPAPETKQELYIVMPINISVTGDYHHLALFLSQIAALKKIVTLDDISIQSVATSTTLLMKLRATAYRYSGDKVTRSDNNELPKLRLFVPTVYTAATGRSPFDVPTMQFNGSKESLASYALQALQMVGTVEKEGEIWALVATADQMIFRVAVGMQLGEREGKVVAIDQRKIDVVQTLQNGVNKEVSLKLSEG